MRSRYNNSFVPSLPDTDWDNQQQTSILPIASILELKNGKGVDRRSCSWTEDAAPWNEPEPSQSSLMFLPFTYKTAITVAWELVNGHTNAPEYPTIRSAQKTSLSSFSEIVFLLPFSLGHSNICCSWITGHSNSDTALTLALRMPTQQESRGGNLQN